VKKIMLSSTLALNPYGDSNEICFKASGVDAIGTSIIALLPILMNSSHAITHLQTICRALLISFLHHFNSTFAAALSI
jgi:hypothetical protein